MRRLARMYRNPSARSTNTPRPEPVAAGRSYFRVVATSAAARNRTIPVIYAPSGPIVAMNTPPLNGPTILLKAFVAESKLIAFPSRSGCTSSPINVRRTGNSEAQTMPDRKVATAKCQYSSTSAMSNDAIIDAIKAWIKSPITRKCLRLTRSANIPRPIPNNIGAIRKKKTSDTRVGLPVMLSATSARTSVSNQRIIPPNAPITQRRLNSGFLKTGTDGSYEFGRVGPEFRKARTF